MPEWLSTAAKYDLGGEERMSRWRHAQGRSHCDLVLVALCGVYVHGALNFSSLYAVVIVMLHCQL